MKFVISLIGVLFTSAIIAFADARLTNSAEQLKAGAARVAAQSVAESTATREVAEAKRLVREGKTDAAEGVLHDIIANGSANERAMAIRHLLVLWRDQPGGLEAAASDMQDRVSLAGSAPSQLQILGALHESQGDAENALAAYRQVAALQPIDPLTRNSMIRLSREVGDHASARQLLQEKVAASKTDASGLHFQIASTYIDEGRNADALEYANVHLGLDKQDWSSLRLQARIQTLVGDYKAAQAILNDALISAPDGRKLDLMIERAEVLHRSGDAEAAEEQLRQALTMTHGLAERTRVNRALISLYERDGRLGEAMINIPESQP